MTLIKEYLPTLLKTAQEQGYEFVTVSELIKANKLIADKPPEFIYEGGSMIKAVCEYAKKYDYPIWIAFKGNNEIGPWGKAMNVTDDMITITRLGDPKPGNVSYILTRQIDYIACEYKEYHEDEE